MIGKIKYFESDVLNKCGHAKKPYAPFINHNDSCFAREQKNRP